MPPRTELVLRDACWKRACKKKVEDGMEGGESERMDEVVVAK
jgi:hypothetical protein